MLYDNPAERLRFILEKGFAIARDTPCWTAWKGLLEVPDHDADDLFAKLGKVMALPRDIQQAVATNFPRQVPGMLDWRQQLTNAFTNQNLSGKWETFIAHVSTQSMHQIGITAELLQAKFGTEVVSEDDLNRLQESLHDYIREVDESGISAHLKNYLGRELSSLVQAMREYRVSGSIPVLKQAEAMVGHVLVDQEYKSFLTNHELGKRLLANLEAAAAIMTVALQLPQLSSGLSTFLALGA